MHSINATTGLGQTFRTFNIVFRDVENWQSRAIWQAWLDRCSRAPENVPSRVFDWAGKRLHFVPNFNLLEVKVFLLTMIHRHPQILYRHTKFISKVHSGNFHTSPKVSFHMNKPDYDINWLKVMPNYFAPSDYTVRVMTVCLSNYQNCSQ